jgi:hypothetical protein
MCRHHQNDLEIDADKQHEVDIDRYREVFRWRGLDSFVVSPESFQEGDSLQSKHGAI